MRRNYEISHWALHSEEKQLYKKNNTIIFTARFFKYCIYTPKKYD